MSNLKFGWAEIDLTPDKKVSLAGHFAERISEYAEKRNISENPDIVVDDERK